MISKRRPGRRAIEASRKRVIGFVAFFCGSLAVCGAWNCATQEKSSPSPAPAPSARGQQAPPGVPSGEAHVEAAFDWSSLRGRCVIAEGYVEGGGKTRPRLHGGAFSIGVILNDPPGDSGWWSLPPGSRVRVRGIVAERADLPVFVEEEGQLPMQGIPVPKGTDIEKARRRFVLENASVTPGRPIDRVEADLKAEIGKDVSLNGVVWSLNGHYWFVHEGVTLHVEGQDKIPGWSSMHGRAVTLHGRLDRRALPRIDQISLKPNRDLADAFLLILDRASPHPVWPVTPSCPPE